MPRVLIAGASGALGRHVTQATNQAGLMVRVFGRNPQRLQAMGDAEIAIGDAVSGVGLTEALHNVDCVFSCLGASVAPEFGAGNRSYHQVDLPANRNLIQAAQVAGAKRIVYISVAEHEQLGHLAYVRAHEQVVALVRESKLSYSIVRPTGFFSAFEAVFRLAQRGRVPLLGDPQARTNPIADADLAKLCVELLLATDNVERTVGGPQTLTRKEIAQLAFLLLGKPEKYAAIPTVLVSALMPLVAQINARVADITRFYLAVSSTDCIAPAYGERTLQQHFQGLARLRQGTIC